METGITVDDIHMTTLLFFLSMSSNINRSPALIAVASRLEVLVKPDATDPALEADLKTFFFNGLPMDFEALNLSGADGAGVDEDPGSGVVGVGSAVMTTGAADGRTVSLSGGEGDGSLAAGGDAFLPKERTSLSPGSRFSPSAVVADVEASPLNPVFKCSASL